MNNDRRKEIARIKAMLEEKFDEAAEMTGIGRVLDASDPRLDPRHPGWVAVRKMGAATDKQLDFLKKLQAEREVSETIAADIRFEMEQPIGPQKRIISEIIDDLLKAPYKSTPNREFASPAPVVPTVPAGRYAAIGRDGTLKFLRVDVPTEGKWAGRTFVKLQHSDDFTDLRGDVARRALEAILDQGAEQCMKRYGLELGKCGHCGRTLTDETSRANGIGPVCAANMGW